MTGILHAQIGGPGPDGAVTLSGETITGGAVAHLVFRTDGTMAKNEGAGNVQIDAATDWIIPNASASSLYECLVSVSGDALDVGTVDTWQDLATQRTFGYSSAAKSGTLTAKIRFSLTGVTLSTNTYSLSTP